MPSCETDPFESGRKPRILGLDVGSKRIGLAISDPLGITAQGLETIHRQNKRRDLAQLERVVRQYEVAEIVIGLPLRMSGAEGTQAEKMQVFAEGVRRFILGLAKKAVLANTLGRPADGLFDLPADALTPGLAWLGMVCYALQIYFDFSGYSDMAVGLARMFGFRFPENFNYPYAARSVTEFWRPTKVQRLPAKPCRLLFI